MGLTIGSIAYVCLLLINSIAILSHDRFLVPLGLTSSGGPSVGSAAPYSYGTGFDSYGHPDAVAEGPGVKQRLVALVGAVRTLLRIPLIPINIVVIVYELLLG
ncbi:immediate early response 3-interacting protein 1, partial [Phenoliferia sp. Uapishka_3]